jgi:hypothetical protein
MVAWEITTVTHPSESGQSLSAPLPLAVERAWSLLMGLPHWDSRMSLFIIASDESPGKDMNSRLFYGGYMAPASVWRNEFAAAWQSRVLSGPPEIPFLHMVDIRSEKFRQRFGLSREDADRRIDAAIDIICRCPSLQPVTVSASGAAFEQFIHGRFRWLEKVSMKSPDSQLATLVKRPDFSVWVQFAIAALVIADTKFDNVEQLDFYVEQNGRLTGVLQYINDELQTVLAAGKANRPDLAEMIGTFTAVPKESFYTQPADVLCWHMQRQACGLLDADDRRRYDQLMGIDGCHQVWSDEQIAESAARIMNSSLEQASRRGLIYRKGFRVRRGIMKKKKSRR